MNLKVIVHKAEEGGFWAEVPSIKGCMTEADTMEELMANLHDAVDACLSVDLDNSEIDENANILEVAF